MTTTINWEQRVGNQRDWVWRGWQTRYTYIRPAKNNQKAIPVILLHGFGASIGHWRQNLEVLGEYHTVYALDLLGWGASEKVTANYSIQFWVEQVYDFWKAFICQPVVLVGNSLGSLVCLAAAATHPDMVQSIVMMSLPDPTLEQEAIPAWLQPAVAGIKSVVASGFILKAVFGLVRRPKILSSWAASAYARRDAITDELLDIFVTPTQDENAVRAFIAIFKAATRPTYSPSVKMLLPTLQIPMLLIWGQKDRWVPPALAQQFAQYNQNLQLLTLENVGHCPHDESPEQVNKIILDWIDGLVEQKE
ncbi:MAG: alpha/beta fold hydrolase [Rhizonema sp. NSF051]|nr:alpha/beta fold hydrolase [Rhizonema sp. NSF051]